MMKNITVIVDDETYRAARIKAAGADTSVSALVRQFLTDFVRGESEAEHLVRREQELRRAVEAFSGADRLSRDDIHARGGR